MRLLVSVLLVSVLFNSFLFSHTSIARGLVFKAKTDDLSVNDKCETYNPSFFLQEEIKYFLVGTEGTKRAGFNEEIAIARGEATLLWATVNPNEKPERQQTALNKIKHNKKLSHYLEILEEGKVIRGAEYQSEGEILEILSYEFLPQSESFNKMLVKYFGDYDYSLEDYFITGGVTYYSESGQTVGELDVIVGDSNTCTIFAIGEAKLGGKKSKALRQLDRIKRFLRSL